MKHSAGEAAASMALTVLTVVAVAAGTIESGGKPGRDAANARARASSSDSAAASKRAGSIDPRFERTTRRRRPRPRSRWAWRPR